VSQTGWDGYLESIYKHKREPHNETHMRDYLENILKLVGGGRTEAFRQHMFNRTYWFVKVFMINGGYGRNFKSGEIEVIELPIYNMEVTYSEDVTDYRVGWGELIGVGDKEEAEEVFDIGFIEDSESQDMDYSGGHSIENIEVQEVTFIKFMPEWVGL
jgi:hypothetical protein